jgi:hypothetical protein
MNMVSSLYISKAFTYFLMIPGGRFSARVQAGLFEDSSASYELYDMALGELGWSGCGWRAHEGDHFGFIFGMLLDMSTIEKMCHFPAEGHTQYIRVQPVCQDAKFWVVVVENKQEAQRFKNM